VRDDLTGTPGLDQSRVGVTMTTHGGDGVDGSCVDDPPTIENPCFSTITVSYTFRTIFQWPGVPQVIGFERSRSFRRL
jgi:hypothetical protein